VPELLRIPTPLVEDPAPADEGVLTRTVDLAVYTLPYPNRGALVAAGTMPDAISQQARAVLDSLLVAAAADLARIPRAIKLFAGHANVTGARASTGQPQVGVDVELDPAMLARLPADVHVAMSHIHKHQTVGRAVYAGSICRMDFGELDPKGIIDIAYDVQPEAITLAGWTFVPLDVPPMYQIDGELTAAGFEFRVVDASASGDMVDLGGAGLELDADGWRPTTWKGADVRVRYTYRRAEASLLNVAHIHAEFAEARSLKIEAIPAAEAEIRAPEVVAATTLVDKLTHYATRHGLVWSPALAEKAADLETRAADDWRQAALARIGAIGADILPE
jgi:hypothetical protein